MPTSAVTGDVGVSPAAASYIAGFSLTADSTNLFATSLQVTRRVYASDCTQPTPTNLTTAIGDVQTAFTDAAGRTPGVTELGAGNIGGMNRARSVYKSRTGLLIPTSVTLMGTTTDVWIFQIPQDPAMSSATSIVLSGGASAANVYWQSRGRLTSGRPHTSRASSCVRTAMVLEPGASIDGRLSRRLRCASTGSAVVEP